MNKRVYVIDGAKFSSLEEFARYFSDVVFEDYQWHGNLDAFNDILRGGFGTPLGGYVLRWENSELSRQNLEYAETARRLETILLNCHSSSAHWVRQKLEQAKAKQGKTLFDEIIEIILIHGVGGEESEDGVELELL